MTNQITIPAFLLRLSVALVLGAVIGIERAWHHRMAGPRTNALVASGSAAFFMMGVFVGGDGAARIAAQIVSGIGFLGAGVILKEGANVRGLNTAATIWCSSAIGTLAGTGLLHFAGLTAAAVILINLAFRPLTYRLNPPISCEAFYAIDITSKAVDALHCRTLMLHSMSREVLVLHSLKARALDADRVRITAILRADVPSSPAVEQLVARLLCDELVAGASWRSVGAIANAEEIADEQALPTSL
jgi:putative Mg2+ transporter-C (MgtC) family protein